MVVWLVVLALATGACGGDAPSSARPPTTVGSRGSLAAGLVTRTQLRQVPGFARATVRPLDQLTVFDDPEPRGACGGALPVVSLQDATAVTVAADTIHRGVQLVARLPAGAAKRYLDARMADTVLGCPAYEDVTPQDTKQTVALVRIVRLLREFDQGLAVVTGLKEGGSAKASTQIEIRAGDVLSRVVVVSDRPLSNDSIRGIASIVGRNLAPFRE